MCPLCSQINVNIAIHILSLSYSRKFRSCESLFLDRIIAQKCKVVVSYSLLVQYHGLKITLYHLRIAELRPSSTKCGTAPLTCPFSLALAIIIANMSTAILNKIGDRGSPCLRPFFVWKYEPVHA